VGVSSLELGAGADQQVLVETLASLSRDPLAFVRWAFPWGEKETILASRHGPEPWQAELLGSIRDGLKTPQAAIREATTSGNGVGKSALVSWIILWAMSTFEDTKGVVTANTETQLKTKTWPELGKWYHLFIAKHLFKFTATALLSADPDHERTWRTDMVAWSEYNVVAFQGLHNEDRRLFIIFDEASGIVDGIWEAAEGCMTDKTAERIWAVFGNPNRPKGRFKECFPGGRFASAWHSRGVDSRSVSFTDRSELDRWVNEYGEDSDFVRVRVRGVFPRAGSMQFIASDVVDAASLREPDVHRHDPLVIGVDVARYGDDASVIYIRKGRDGRSHPPIKLRGVDTMTLAGRVAEVFSELRADAIFVDGTGVGGGVVDRLRQLHVPVWDIQFGAKSDCARDGLSDGVMFANKRAEIWGAMREWLKGGAIPRDPELTEQLIGPEYTYNLRQEIQLERKEDMKKRGLASPDLGDALALTFAYPVIPHALAGGEGPNEPLVETEYNPFENAA
jgi:hypothetical protein